MKKILALIIFSIILSLISCNDYLDKTPDDQLTLEMVFNDKKRTEEWLAGIYPVIQDPLFNNMRNMGLIAMGDDAQIAFAMSQFYAVWDWILTNNQGGINPVYSIPQNVWKDTYIYVRSALIFINEVKPLPSQGQTDSNVEQMKREARFLIAYGYQKILELYGPFPLVTELMSSDMPIEDMMLPRTPYDDIVAWLDNEYRDLANFFPARYDNPDMMYGRPTKGMCLAMRARLHLYAASPLFNGNPDFSDLVNKDGTHIFSTSYDKEKWKKAYQATREFLDLAEAGYYDLYREYKDGVIDPFLSFQNAFLATGNINPEIVFPRANSDYSWANKVGNPRAFVGGSGYYGATQNLADAFFMKNGLSPILGYNSDHTPIINPVAGYTETGFTSGTITYPNTNYDLNSTKTKGVVVESDVFNMYANREPRFYISLWYDNEFIPLANRRTDFKNGGVDGGPTHDAPQCGYLMRKFVNPQADPKNNKIPYQPGIVMRLAEFYLNYAEALNEYDYSSNLTEILKYVNLIRERAGIPIYGPGVDDIPIPADQDKMREAIWKERRVEFALETDIRYNDIRRWKYAEELFKTPIYGMDKSTTGNNFYKRTVFMNRVFTKKNYLWPIYQNYIDNNPNLVQNKFW